MPLGETLISKGVITPDQLKQALDAQKKEPGKKIGELLVQLGFIDAAALDKALG